MKRQFMLLSAGATLAFTAGSADAASLLHHWTFDADGTDSAGTANATLESGVTITTGGAGVFGEAVSIPEDPFGAVTSGTSAVTLPLTDFSFTAWVKVDSNSPDGFLTVMGNQAGGSASGVFMRIDDEGSDGDLFGRVNNAAGSLQEGGTVNKNVWTHVAMTVSSTAGLTLYVNGVNVGNNPGGTSHVLSTQQFEIGTRSLNGSQDFHGLIDDVAVFSGALTQQELDAVISSGAAAVPEPGSLALLAMGGLCVLRRRRG